MRLYRRMAAQKHEGDDSGELAASARDRRDENNREGNSSIARDVDEEIIQRELRATSHYEDGQATSSPPPGDGSELVVSGTKEVAPARDESNGRK
jgi:hypothetical protein